LVVKQAGTNHHAVMTDADFLREEPPVGGFGGQPDPVTDYLRKLERALKRGDATEHTYRPALKELIEALDEKVLCTNEPKRSQCGAPDYAVSRKGDQLNIGYMEAKNIGADLAEDERGGQLKRYLPGLPNLLLTDYLEFRWFVEGEKRGTFRLANVAPGGKVAPVATQELERARLLLLAFTSQEPVDIVSAEQLARRLAFLAKVVHDVIIGAFQTGQASQQLRDWRDAFAATLLPELAPHADAAKEAEAVREFADMFAQTLAYGLFSARVSSGSGKFTREKAQRLIPRTNPFLRTFFEQITGAALDEEPFADFLEDLIQTLDHADMGRVMEDFGKHGPRRDPVVHFYETFLQAYDPKLRELRGVYYTPEPVVNYIVQSIDRLLKDKFRIKAGLADHQKIKLPPGAAVCDRRDGEADDRRSQSAATEECHRVLILDPATGTATFLYTVLDFIRSQFKTRKNAGQWGSYVHEHLLPRLFGFELLMAPYAVAHFKIGLALAAMDEEHLFRQQWSYEPQGGERVNIFLTNTLEDLEHTAEQLGPLRVLSNEANAASEVKRHKPVLVVLGNPPYSGHSANTGEWISKLVRDYYFCDGQPLGERNPKWLQDDYVKFLRWGQWRIEQTGQGILAFITNHGYLDNPTFRGMRQNLMQTFDEIYVLDLHGNSKKKETVPGSGEADKNVFDIRQGVAIGLFVKLPSEAKRKKGPATVRHLDLWGAERQKKYDWLNGHHVENTKWTMLDPTAPHYLFIPQHTRRRREYELGWGITEMMPVNSAGIVTARDSLTICWHKIEVEPRVKRFAALSVEGARAEFKLGPDTRDWKVPLAQEDINNTGFDPAKIRKLLYRPFDLRWTYYSGTTRGFLCMPRPEVMAHLIAGNNLAMILTRQTRDNWAAFSTQSLVAHKSVAAYDINSAFPLYLHRNGKLPAEDLFPHDNGRRPNLSAGFVKDFCEKLQVKFVPDGLGRPGKREVGPESIFNYAYAVFHSPAYRERYAEFLRADFPRLPLTGNWELYRSLSELGLRLVNLHARGEGEGKGPGFPMAGDNCVEAVRYQPPQGREPGRVWINHEQFFEGVPEGVWAFPVGGYLPAQRWLKDRKHRKLAYEDISAYARIIFALAETRKLMAQIDQAIESHGGWPFK
jgi:hypothetical protein